MSVSKIYEAARLNRESDGAAVIQSKDVAVLIRHKLKNTFPGVKFSVRSDRDSVNVSWVDGPTQKQVNGVIDAYSFGGFDGSIDYAYCGRNWLLPNGDMVTAWVENTRRCGGYIAGESTDCPAPGAVIVKYGPRYVFGHRSWSDERYAELREMAIERFRLQADVAANCASDPYCNSWGEYLSTLVRRFENEMAKSK
jgi:hypothetical protein